MKLFSTKPLLSAAFYTCHVIILSSKMKKCGIQKAGNLTFLSRFSEDKQADGLTPWPLRTHSASARWILTDCGHAERFHIFWHALKPGLEMLVFISFFPPKIKKTHLFNCR